MMQANFATQPISWFRRERDSNTLNLSPEFQRRLVWNEERQAYLIDTVLSGLPIPEVYMRTITSPDGKTVYDIVDGQQRLSAVLRFAANDLELEGDEVSPKWRGLRLSDLPEELKQKFWSYRFVVRDLGAASDGEVRDLFRRLNINSVVLNDQELRHAKFKGEFIGVVERLADDKWWLDAGVVTVNQVRRMLDVEFVSELLVALMAGPQDKKSTLDDYYENYEIEFPDKEKWVQKFQRTRALISATMPNTEVYAWSGRSDFYSLFLFFARLEDVYGEMSARSRKKVANALTAFAKEVELAKKRGNKTPVSKEARVYAEAVTRAASDLARRVERLAILESVIQVE